jgi:uncharacterized protein (TIGR00369 family)
VSLTARPRAVPFLPGGPEAMLHVGDVGGTSAQATGAMRTGPWVLAADGVTPSPGSLGVLADVVWGGAAVACAPARVWGASTQLTVSFGAPLPADGSLLWAGGEAVHHDSHTSLGVGWVKTADGRLVATGTQRTRFMAEIPAASPPPVVHASRDDRDLATLLGLTYDDADQLRFPTNESVANPAGNVHGGILFSLVELAAADAIGAAGAGLSAEAVSVHYLRASHVGETLRCETEVLHRGRTAATVVVRCRRPDDRICAMGTAHFGPVEASKE